MTTGASLITRVRSNVLEPTANQRSDAEILQWLIDSVFDYVAKVPPEAVQALTVTATSGTTQWSIATDFFRLMSVKIVHTISGTLTENTPCTILKTSDEFMESFYTSGLGAFARIAEGKLKYGPSAVSAVVTYQKHPATMATTGATFPLEYQHEEPVVNRASMMACLKINDADADKFKALYDERVAAEKAAYKADIEVTA